MLNFVLIFGAALLTGSSKEIRLLNVSYDPTRELYQEVNAAFAKSWQEKSGDTVRIHMTGLGTMTTPIRQEQTTRGEGK